MTCHRCARSAGMRMHRERFWFRPIARPSLRQASWGCAMLRRKSGVAVSTRHSRTHGHSPGSRQQANTRRSTAISPSQRAPVGQLITTKFWSMRHLFSPGKEQLLDAELDGTSSDARKDHPLPAHRARELTRTERKLRRAFAESDFAFDAQIAYGPIDHLLPRASG